VILNKKELVCEEMKEVIFNKQEMNCAKWKEVIFYKMKLDYGEEGSDTRYFETRLSRT
jgi:hypothetical protein